MLPPPPTSQQPELALPPRPEKWRRAQMRTLLFYVGSAVVHLMVVFSLLAWTIGKQDAEERAAAKPIDTEIKEEPQSANVMLTPTDDDKVAYQPIDTIALKVATTEGPGSSAAGEAPKLEQFEGDTESDHLVAAALKWFHRHQNRDGSWSLNGFTQHCQKSACTGQSQVGAEAAATAFGLLANFAAGQSAAKPGPYRESLTNAVAWLIAGQKSDGDLSQQAEQVMFSHALATIALCEEYRLGLDERTAQSAQQAVRFIQSAQHPETGGWQYRPGELGDTASTTWQLVALASARQVGLAVEPTCLQRAAGWYRSVSQSGTAGGVGYVPGWPGDASMTAAGLLARHCLGMRPEDLLARESVAYLQSHLPPEEFSHAPYSACFITHALHQNPGPQNHAWSERIRLDLARSQAKVGCEEGSWYSPDSTEFWTPLKGRLVTTSLAVLALTSNYRHLQIFQLDAQPLARRPARLPSSSPRSVRR